MEDVQGGGSCLESGRAYWSLHHHGTGQQYVSGDESPPPPPVVSLTGAAETNDEALGDAEGLGRKKGRCR